MGVRMGAMYKLKAYFGMVPAEELGEYADEPVGDRYPAPRRVAREVADERWDSGQLPEERDRHDEEWDRPSRPVAGERAADRGSGARGLGSAAVRGSLAIDPDAVQREPARFPERPAVAAVPEQRERVAPAPAGPARITTLQPRSYNEARTIGERYRDGVPVIMNLTELDDAAAKRLVDFAAGLAFALRGSIDKVTSRVFLLTPADVEVSVDDARKLTERSSGGARVDTERGPFRSD